MSSIGPQLPPQLAKRKRDDDDARSDPASPRPKQARNTDEIDLASSDDEDDGFGPSAPKPAVGPTMPTRNEDEIDVSDSDSSTGPAPPPQSKPTADSDSDSDSEDDYGPALPSQASRPHIGPSMPPQEGEEDGGAAPTQRDDWMLAPPTNSGYTERDPTKLRSRKFAAKSSSSGGANAEISSIWTETPEEKMKRLKNSVLGRSEPSSAAAASSSRPARVSPPRQVPEENAEEKKRRKKLAEENLRKRGFERKREEEDDPSKRAFDHEKDMAISGRMSGKDRTAFLNQAKDFGGRFTKGSSS